MRFFNVPFFVALLGLTEAAPKPNSRKTQHHTSTKVSYKTQLAVEPHYGHVPTATLTRTQTLPPIIIIYTSHPTVTKTPPVVTDTKTKFVKRTTSVTAKANTDTVCVTSTEFDTTTRTHTPPAVTNTVCTDTTITTTSTSHIPTIYGFTPIVDTLPTSTAVEEVKRDLVSLERRSQVIGHKDFKYPKSVKCIHEVFVEVIIIEIIIGHPITKWLPAHTTCVTKTDTISVTKTIVPPDVSATVTDTITSTVCVGTTLPVETDTVTRTDTATASVVSTAYDACATNNIAISPFSSDYGRLAGLSPQYLPLPDGVTLTQAPSNINTPYDCCVSCVQDTSCVLASLEDGVCSLVNAETCDPSENRLTAYISARGYTDVSLSNGACGYLVGHLRRRVS
ncbi:hypothetical protein N7474_011066 [Penicillium riverlandense]|uniref:uncharacterized protein n=1 Tax=Penicillium riverlandense TaxID=1903569 RepID=UPI002548B735|nr:uncharacterized protein N7474_011066 [Penicillium riverlandense]KAJ5805179.1 hypothetical protein N7474_011066 [Penicillium riverlandense]